jgi:hypothetical protein
MTRIRTVHGKSLKPENLTKRVERGSGQSSRARRADQAHSRGKQTVALHELANLLSVVASSHRHKVELTPKMATSPYCDTDFVEDFANTF